MSYKKVIVFCGILFISCIPVFSQTLKEKAEGGDKVAQFEYAHKLEEWYPKEEDYQQAVYWLQQSANQGYAPAQCNLGYHYDTGKGVKKDKEQAIFWYRKAAEQGDATAQYNLGLSYSYGDGVNKSESTALFWFKKSANQGYANAEYSVGKAYYHGKGTPENNKLAFEWFNKAANNKHAGAMYYLGECYFHGHGVVKDMVKAIEWYRKSADGYDTEAEYKLAQLYFEGNGVEKDSIAGVKWVLHSAGGGWLQPGIIYSYEKDNVNRKAENKLLELCSLQSSKYLHYFLALEGYLCNAKQDYINAEKYYKEAIELGSLLAVTELGLMYFYISANTPQLYEYYNYDWESEDGPELGMESWMFNDNSACVKYASNKQWTNDDNVTYWLEKAVEYGMGHFQYGAMGYTVYDHLLYAYVDGVGSNRNIERAVDVSLQYLTDTNVDGGDRYNVLTVLSLALEKTNLQSKVVTSCKKLYQEFKNSNNEKYNDGIIQTACILGRCYYKGTGVQKDYNLAYKYLMDAVGGYDCESMRLLAACYRYGRGTVVDTTKEKEWVDKAAECGDEKARHIKEER